MSSPHYRLRSGRLHGGPSLSIHERPGSLRSEGYPNRRSILNPVSTDPSWYLSDSEWDTTGDDQLPEFESHYPISHLSNDHRLPLYDRESHDHYDRGTLRRKVHKHWANADYFNPSVSSRQDSFDGSSPETGLHLRSYPRMMVMRDELVDPSVFSDSSAGGGWDRPDRPHRSGHSPPGIAKPLRE
ncbi:unnamed protein product [Echinostoma caproni]|uniref:Uncharacterized protein n=1 Tax=Echinostoma caproni TaxID=27848 RepID=A0A183BG31_9TREM|nr:unnamed protein product [Echinostoma caproni]